MPHALLIDGENLSSAHAPAILAAVPPDAPVRRVYGDAARLNGWLSVPGLRAVHASPGKNAADILLAIEAVQLACTGAARHFAIATSDTGLIHLVQHLREAGKTVTVLGADITGPALRAAAHRFVCLSPPPEKPVALPPPKPDLRQFVMGEIRKAGSEGLPVTHLNTLVQREFGTRIGTLPEKTWRAWLTADSRKALFDCDPKGPDARVRLTRQPAPPPDSRAIG
ncbi:MAG: NYN domain-containing protein [Gemmobacter sp.]